MSNQPPQELGNQAEQLVKRVDQLQPALKNSSPIRKPVMSIMWGCFALGTISLVFCLFKAGLGTANTLDWGILFVGFTLCTISMLKKFDIGASGITAELSDVLNQAKDLVMKVEVEASMNREKAQHNADKEVWREEPDNYYSPSLRVTQGGAIGIDVGGTVIVKTIRDWHRLAMRGGVIDQEKLKDLLRAGIELVESAYAHSHGGRTRPEIWLKQAKDVLLAYTAPNPQP